MLSTSGLKTCMGNVTSNVTVLPPSASSQCHHPATTTASGNHDLTIKVINPKNKKDAKVYVISVPVTSTATLTQLREVILEQLGKKVVHVDLVFDVGYVSSGSTKICFKEAEDMNVELNKVVAKGHVLWCEGVCQLIVSHAAAASTIKPIVLDSNSQTDDEDIDKPSEKKIKTKNIKTEKKETAETEKKSK